MPKESLEKPGVIPRNQSSVGSTFINCFLISTMLQVLLVPVLAYLDFKPIFVPYWLSVLFVADLLRLPTTSPLSLVLAFGLVFVSVAAVTSLAVLAIQLIKRTSAEPS